MKIKVFVKVVFLLFCLFSGRESFTQSFLDSVDWVRQQEIGCVDIQEKLATRDSSASPGSLVEACRCALLLKNGELAISYLRWAVNKGFRQTFVTEILQVRAFSLLGQDDKAVELLEVISQKTDLFLIMKLPEMKALARRNAQAMQMYHTSLPAFDVFTFIISTICFLGFFAGLLFFIKGKGFSQFRWLGLFIINFSIIMSSFVLYWTKYNWVFPYLNVWWHPLYLLTGPLFYFYIRNITGQKNTVLLIALHLLPFVLCIGVFLFNGLFLKTPIFNNGSNVFLAIFQGMPLKLISLILYFVLSLIEVNGDWMTDIYVRKWIRSLFIFFGVFILANAVYYGCTFWEGFNKDWDYGISAVMALGITGVAAMGFLESGYLSFKPVEKDRYRKEIKHKTEDGPMFKSLEDDGPDIKKYKSSTITAAVSDSVKVKLEKLMSENRLYQRENLRLQDVAGMVGMHRNQVSQIINENFNLSFFEWLNKYRIYHAADLLSTPHCPYTISQVGFESGFNNKVTFYKTFRQYFQCTPLEYVSRLAEKRSTMN